MFPNFSPIIGFHSILCTYFQKINKVYSIGHPSDLALKSQYPCGIWQIMFPFQIQPTHIHLLDLYHLFCKLHQLNNVDAFIVLCTFCFDLAYVNLSTVIKLLHVSWSQFLGTKFVFCFSQKYCGNEYFYLIALCFQATLSMPLFLHYPQSALHYFHIMFGQVSVPYLHDFLENRDCYLVISWYIVQSYEYRKYLIKQ